VPVPERPRTGWRGPWLWTRPLLKGVPSEFTRLWTVHGDGKHIPPTEWSRLTSDLRASDHRSGLPARPGDVRGNIHRAGVDRFPPNTTIFFSGIGTLIFLLVTIGRGQRLGLPSYLGSSFAFISPVLVAEQHGGIPSALAGILVAGAVFFVIGVIVNKWGSAFIEWLMPPVVTGAVVALIGLNLASSAFTNFNKQPWTGFATLCGVILVTVVFAASSAASRSWSEWLRLPDRWAQGQISFTAVKSAAWIGLPHFTGRIFSMRPIFLIVPVVIVLIAENTATSRRWRR